MSKPFLPSRWKELAPLLDAALECEAHERPAFLDRACADDPSLRPELEGLIAECARSDRLLASGAIERFGALLGEPMRRLPETVAERYRIGREIGAGGMAIVYLARDLKHDRDVALKVLRADLSAVIGAERFLAEVRITAKLDHPHILTLIDSGAADGILFYVLPYVRGETLRAKLLRERQLSIPEALSIARQVASALDYAHAQGVVHRDIKPENILLHEGEAVLADFGIALAVREAGGKRLTETGISLGTPSYMSPEQATGDRGLDARTDIYSLAAVIYEMIAGEPPVTGATAQAIVAKLLTERPTRLRVVRDTVPDAVDRAVDKALSKVPADRFATAGAFAAALDAPVNESVPAAPRRWRPRTFFAALGVLAVVGLVAILARGKFSGGSHAGITLANRRQLTFTGDVAIPAISGDGRALAYRTTNCTPAGCTFGIELQDVVGPGSRRLISGASSIYGIEWSPDRRNLLFTGTINPTYGTFLIPALGGMPRRVPYQAKFFAGGDSLLSLRTPAGISRDKWLLVSGLDGVTRDSTHIGDPGDGLTFFGTVPGSKWIVVGLYARWNPKAPSIALEARVIARDGRVVSRTVIGHSGTSTEGHASSDALWVSPGGQAWSKRHMLRIPLDAATGRLSAAFDTLYTGVHTAFSVTGDGKFLVLDEGTTEFKLWGLDVSEAVHGVFPEDKRLLSSTSALNVRLSPDGERVLIGRDPGADTNGLQLWSTTSFRRGGGETSLSLSGTTSEVMWFDNNTLALKDRITAGARFALMDLTTGALREPLDAPDRFPSSYSRLREGGWLWVRSGQPELSVQLSNESSPRRIALDAWYAGVYNVDATPDGHHAALAGELKAPAQDSIGVSVMSLDDTTVRRWFTTFGEEAAVDRLKDGSLLLRLRDTPETYALYHILGPGRAEKLGAIPRRVSSLSVSEDLKRAAVVVRDYQGDAWMSRVVRP